LPNLKSIDIALADGRIVTAIVADTFIKRLFGYMFTAKKKAIPAIFFPRCNMIHTFFMFFPIDVYFLDVDKTVIKSIKSLKPWRMAMCLQASGVLEISGS
jgi:uncharacterized membrane protein (UPF0127 family)